MARAGILAKKCPPKGVLLNRFASEAFVWGVIRI